MTKSTTFSPVPDDVTRASDSTLLGRPDSPCIGICSTLFDEVCQGCGRTQLEVSNWVLMTDEERDAVWARILADGTAQGYNADGSRK